MDSQGIITKLKEAVFLKKSTGQTFEKEEETLKGLEAQLAQEEAESRKRATAIDEKEKASKENDKKIKALKSDVVQAARAWRKAAMDLFKAERGGEELLDETKNLSREHYGADRVRTGSFERSIFIGSQRARWVDGELDVLTEDFRRELIVDNREFYSKKGDGRRRRRKPVKQQAILDQFIPDRYEVFQSLQLPIPDWWHAEYMAYKKQHEKDLAKLRAPRM